MSSKVTVAVQESDWLNKSVTANVTTTEPAAPAALQLKLEVSILKTKSLASVQSSLLPLLMLVAVMLPKPSASYSTVKSLQMAVGAVVSTPTAMVKDAESWQPWLSVTKTS